MLNLGLTHSVSQVTPASSYSNVAGRIPVGSPSIRRDNRNQGSSHFNVSAKRDLQKLPLLKGIHISGLDLCHSHNMMHKRCMILGDHSLPVCS